MSKFTITIINIILSGYVVTLCLICLFEFDLWQDKTHCRYYHRREYLYYRFYRKQVFNHENASIGWST